MYYIGFKKSSWSELHMKSESSLNYRPLGKRRAKQKFMFKKHCLRQAVENELEGAELWERSGSIGS